MSRRKTKQEDIRNPEHYFNRYIAKERLKDREKQAEYDNFFCSLDEKLTLNDGKIGGRGQMLIAVNENDDDLEEQLAERSFFAWIDYIECTKLHYAICQMSVFEKKLLTLRFRYGLTQRETAEIMKITQVAVHRRERKLLNQLRTILTK